ncbi:MAG: acyl--CoA ligase [Bacilli bacterium]|nr:acyl--CoA ligase [Bacilli bacterium]
MIENLTLYQAYVQASLKTPSETAIYYFENRISYAKLLERIDEMASILQNLYRIEKGDVVLVSLPNIPETIVLFYALNKIGAISNMVHPNSPYEVMQKYYNDANCKIAFLFENRVYKELSSYMEFNGNIVLCSAANSLPLRKKEAYFLMNRKMIKDLKEARKFQFYANLKSNNLLSKEVVLEPEDTSVLLHSASTTGISKTICLGSKSFNFTASRIPEIMCVEPEELIGKSLISVLPSFHGFGLCMTMHAPLVNSFGIVLIPKFSTKEIVHAMNRWKNVTCICGVPNIFKELIKDSSFINSRQLKTLASCFSGGDSLSPLIKENFDSILIRKNSRCRLFEGYGLTEALAVCSVNTHRHHKTGSIGYPISGVSFAIIGEDNKMLKPYEIGEISIKSDNNMIGYYNDLEATKATYYNGYLKTGDLGFIDEDGFIYFKARKKRVIKVNGVAVFPHEIESVISAMSGISAVCVVEIPDEKTVNAAKVYVVSKDKDPDRIKNQCRRKLISWSIPKEVEFVKSLPMTKYNKVDYRKVQEMENKKRRSL